VRVGREGNTKNKRAERVYLQKNPAPKFLYLKKLIFLRGPSPNFSLEVVVGNW
jgi:hypothetical protein